MVPLELISDLQRAKEFLGPTSAIANKHGRNGANTAHDHNRDKKLGRKVVLETRSSLRFSRSSPRSRSREDASKKRAKASLHPLPLPTTVINRAGRGCYAPTPIVDWWISPSVHLLLADLDRNNHVLTGRDPEGANPDVVFGTHRRRRVARNLISLRVINHALQRFARACKSAIAKEFHFSALCCTVLRSR
jgi:hypothetical protein